MNKNFMRTSDKGFIKFRFMYRPEYLKLGITILFREGRTKGLCVVSRIFSDGAPNKEGDTTALGGILPHKNIDANK
jgi:hypothetical protein